MIRGWIFVLLILGSSANLFGQQDPLFTQYMYNMNIINPAYAGSVEAAEFGLTTRAQWVGFSDSPKTISLAASTPLPIMDNLGFGLSLVSDINGPVVQQDIYIDLSYRIQLHQTGTLSFGLKGGNTLDFFDTSNFDSNNTDFLSIENSNYWNVGAGLYYQDRSIYISLSVPKLLNYTGESLNQSNAINRNYYLSAGYVYAIERFLQIKPSFLLRYAEGGDTSFDLNANLLWYESIETGISYRYNSSISAMVNLKITENLRLGYAFDYGIGDLWGTNASAHEIFVLFDLQSKRQRFTSPRFF